MNVFMSPKKAARVLGIDERTVRNRIRNGAIKHVFTNGGDGAGVRYIIDMTREFGITGEGEANDAEKESAPICRPKQPGRTQHGTQTALPQF